MIKHKSDPYVKILSTLSKVRMVPSLLSLLNILCTIPVKRYYCQNNDLSLTCHGLSTCSSTYRYHRSAK